MKICLINNLYKPYNRGGAENVVEAMINNYIAQGDDVFLITTKPSNTRSETPNFPTYYIQSDFYNLNQKSYSSRLLWHFCNTFSFRKYFQIIKILKNEKPDLVITHNLIGISIGAALAVRNLGVNHYHFLHDIQLLHPSGLLIYGQEKMIKSWISILYQGLTRLLINSPSIVISPSKWLISEHTKRSFFKRSKLEIRKLDSIFSNFDKNNIEPENNNTSGRNLLFVGQIEEHKGIIFLIQAFLDKATPDYTLTIVGEGSQLDYCRHLAGNDQRINFLGKRGKEEVKKIMINSDLLILPSLCYENYPLTIVEAHLAGIRVVASNLGGIPENINQNDRLFIPGDKEDLFDKIEDLLSK